MPNNLQRVSFHFQLLSDNLMISQTRTRNDVLLKNKKFHRGLMMENHQLIYEVTC